MDVKFVCRRAGLPNPPQFGKERLYCRFQLLVGCGHPSDINSRGSHSHPARSGAGWGVVLQACSSGSASRPSLRQTRIMLACIGSRR